MAYNAIGLFPKKSDNPGKKFRKSSRDFDDIKKALVATIDTIFKEGTTETVDRENKHKT